MNAATWSAAVVALSAVVSGCLSADLAGTHGVPPAADAAQEVVWSGVRAALEGVPCRSEPVGPDTTANVRALARLPFDEARPGELDVHDGLALAADRSSGVRILDVADPLSPREIGAHRDDDLSSLDVKFSPDGATAIVGDGEGIVFVDVRDPSAPRESGRWSFSQAPDPPLGRESQNAHMVAAARIAGSDWLFVAPNSNSGLWILRLVGPPESRTAEYMARTTEVGGGPLGPHDLHVQQDPLDGRWLLYSADGFLGWTVYDVTDPAHPAFAGGLVNPAELAYTHSIQPVFVDGRRLVATTAEIGPNLLRVYDATDLRLPRLLGAWQAKPGAGSGDPQHNVNVVGARLYVAHYLNGLYVFDLTGLADAQPLLGTLELQPVAHYATARGDSRATALFGGFWDVVVERGVVYVTHMSEGLHVVGDGCLRPGDVGQSSVG